MCKSIGVIAIKGGVGKTTISAALAASLVNNYKKRVLLIDANYSAPNLAFHTDVIEPKKTIHDVLKNNAKIESAIHKKFGMCIIPGIYEKLNPDEVLKLKDKIRKLRKDYDFIIIDSSPSLNEEILSAMLASDKLFVVTTPDYPTLNATLHAAKLAKQRGKPIAGLIINKIRDPLYELTLKEIEKISEIPVVARIPDDKKAARALFTRIPITIYNKKSPMSKEIEKLSGAMANRVRLSFIKKLLPFHFKKEEVNREILKQNFYEPIFK